MANDVTATYTQLCRKQRAAYFAWQAAPAGNGAVALAAYIEASKELEAAQNNVARKPA